MRRWIAVTALSACVLSFTSLVGMSSGGTVTPPPSQGIASASVTAAYIEQLQLGIEFTTDPSQATNVAASINAMNGSVYGYAVQLLASQISLSQVAMADSALMEGVTAAAGTATTPNSLTLFTTQFLPGQVVAALANGYNPTVYAAQALSLALGGNAAFNTNYVSLNASQFVSSVATRTGLHANAIAGWLQNWTAFYTANPTATQGLTLTQAAYGGIEQQYGKAKRIWLMDRGVCAPQTRRCSIWWARPRAG